jgi:hypothetical protein
MSAHTFDLIDLIETSLFFGIRPSMTQAEVETGFMQPCSKEAVDETTEIWTYGNMELHFGQTGLRSIFCDNLDDFNMGTRIGLRNFPFRQLSEVSLPKLAEYLNEHQIDYTVINRNTFPGGLANPHTAEIRASGNHVVFLFECPRYESDNSNEFLLRAFWIQDTPTDDNPERGI